MIRSKPFVPPVTCRVCGKAVASSIVHASELHGGNVCTVTCVDRHM